MINGKLPVIVGVVVFIVVLVKPFIIYQNTVFYGSYLSDEFYYIPAGMLLLSRITGIPYSPPYEVNISVVNGTTTISIDATRAEIPMIFLPGYDWRNLEHPAFAKLVYGVIYYLTGEQVSLFRIVLLVISSVFYGIFAYAVAKRFGLFGVAGIAMLLAVDRLTLWYSFIGFLDTLMVSFLLGAVAFYLLDMKKTSLTLLSLSAACKLPGVIPAIAFSITEYHRKSLKNAILFLIIPALSLVASYMINLVFASFSEIIRSVTAMSMIVDVSTCTPLCLFALEENWGGIVLYPVFVWVWFGALFTKVLLNDRLFTERNIATSIAVVYILFIVATAARRTVYVYYYLPVVALSSIAIAEILEFLYRKTKIHIQGLGHER